MMSVCMDVSQHMSIHLLLLVWSVIAFMVETLCMHMQRDMIVHTLSRTLIQ